MFLPTYKTATSTTAPAQPFFQPKLTVNQPGDAYEQEADRVADQVMRMRDGEAPVVQRMGITPVSGVQRKCAECEKEEQIQRKETAGAAVGHTAPPIVSDVLASGGGQPLDGGTRQFMETRFGQDFSQVCVHVGGKAAESAAAIQAKAYTSGSNVVFGAGQYSPHTPDGRHLLAHELVHVGQQGGAAVRRQRRPAPTGPAAPTSTMTPCSFPLAPIASAATTRINNAVIGLTNILSNWGQPVSAPLLLASAQALRSGFNIEYDKTLQYQLARDLQLGSPAEIRARDVADRAATQTILANFQTLLRNAAAFITAGACQQGMPVGTPCYACYPQTFSRCSNPNGEAMAFVHPQAMGQDLGPVLFCPVYSTQSPDERIDIFIHELAHLAAFAASDWDTQRRSRYYGCPVAPIEPFAPGLTDPADFIRIAASYECFIRTQRTGFRFFRDLRSEAPAAYSRADRPQIERVQQFLVQLTGQILGLASSTSPAEPWATVANPNVQAMLDLLNRLNGELANESLHIVFDPALMTGNVAASYDYLNNQMKLRAYRTDEERNMIAIDLFHEYTHARQDQLREQQLATQQTPHTATRAEDLGNEIEARRQQVYFSWFVRRLGYRFAPSQAGFQAELSDRVFLSRFERERTAATPRERSAATREIHSELESHYDAQLTRNSNVKTYRVTIDAQDHAWLHHDVRGVRSPEDLGHVGLPTVLMAQADWQQLIESRLTRLGYYRRLFSRGARQHFDIVTFFITENNRKVHEFGLEFQNQTP